jgi:hypothetical protein
MLIRKAYIRNVESYLASLPAGVAFRPVVEVGDQLMARLPALGFPPAPENGHTVLPAPVGPVSRFNADGRWSVHRDLAKEERYIRTVSWRWKQWAGRDQTEEREEFRDINRECYPRTPVPPPGVELTFLDGDGARLLIAPLMENVPEQVTAIGHVINLLLELAGECQLVREDFTHFAPPLLHRVNWSMLPPGAHPWERVETHLRDVLKRTSDNTQRVILDRQATIMEHRPDEQYVGLGGFSDYIAYVFTAQGVVVLESIRRDNAIYIFGDGWQSFAKLTKAEVLGNRLHRSRIVHSTGWKERLAQAVGNRAAAA